MNSFLGFRRAIVIALLLSFAGLSFFACHGNNTTEKPLLLGTFKFEINPAQGTTKITPYGNTPMKFLRHKNISYDSKLEPLFNLGWDNSINYSTGLERIKPSTCESADYNEESQILTASVRLTSQTNTGTPVCPTGSETYCDQTYIAPLELRIYAITPGGICDTVCDSSCTDPSCICENLSDQKCIDMGITLESELFRQSDISSMNKDSGCSLVTDVDTDGWLDCMADDPHFAYTEPDYAEYKYHPTWDYTQKLDAETQSPAQALDPGEDSGCKFLQFTFLHPELDSTHIPILTFYADVLGYVEPLPGEGLNPPVVAPVTTPTRISSQSITVILSSAGDYTGDTVKITGGATEVNCKDNDPCDTNTDIGTVVVSVDLNSNVTNNLYVHQKDTTVPYLYESSATVIQIVHDDIPPEVSLATPLQNAINISTGTNAVVTFNEMMDDSTISTSTLTLYRGATQIAGTVSLSSDKYTAVFDPTANLNTNSLHTYTVFGAALPCVNCVKDLAGNSMTTNYTSSFTTAAANDTTRPTVTSTNPPDNANGISIDTTIQIQFSEAVNPTYLTSSTFIISDAGGPIIGTLDLSPDGITATFTPSSLLDITTLYTATVKGLPDGIRDLYGNIMSADYIFTFQTGTEADITPPTIVSTNPLNMASNISESVSPQVIFSEPINPTTITTANLYLKKSDETIINSAVSLSQDGLTATLDPYDVLDNSETYVLTIGENIADYAGNILGIPSTVQFITRDLPDTTPPTVVDTNPNWYAGGVSLYTNVVVIFSEPLDPTTVSSSTVRLLRGATPVPGTVELSDDGYTAYYWQTSPPLNAETGHYITVTGGVNGVKDRAGNALATTYSGYFRTSSSYSGSPYIVGVAPEAGSTNVPLNDNIIVTFSEPVTSTDVTDTTFYLRIPPSATHIDGTISVFQDKLHARFKPASNLSPSTTYSMVTTTGIRDLSTTRNFLASATSFTTGTTSDTDGPTVASINPTDGSTNIERWQNITVTFNEPVDPNTVSVSSIELIRDYDSSSVGIEVSVSANGLSATINPLNLLNNYEWFTVKVKTSIRNLAGYALQSYTESQFRTKDTSGDTTPPSVQSTVPADGSTGQTRDNFSATVYMSESIDPGSAKDGFFSIDTGDVLIVQPVTIAIYDQVAGDPNPGLANSKIVISCYPSPFRLERRTWYRIYVDHNLTDYAGNNMTDDFTSDFRTGN